MDEYKYNHLLENVIHVMHVCETVFQNPDFDKCKSLSLILLELTQLLERNKSDVLKWAKQNGDTPFVKNAFRNLKKFKQKEIEHNKYHMEESVNEESE